MQRSTSRQRSLCFQLLWCGVLGLACVPAVRQTHAQGTRDDYERAAALREAVNQTVFRDQVEPHWIDQNTFWYRVSIGRQRHEFILVNAAQGKRDLLLDHQRLAAALSKKLNRQIAADALPLGSLTVEPELKHVSFSVGRKRFRCDLTSYELSEVSAADPQRESLPPLQKAPTSRSNGPETEVLFVNETKQRVKLFWRNQDGKRIPYGTIEPGGEHRQHTYADHAWEITDLQERTLVGFVATAEPNQAIIGKDVKPTSRPTMPVTDPHVSPDGKWKVRFQDHNVVLQSVDGKKEEVTEHVLTSDGTDEDSYGGRVHWSPDSQQFVVMQTRAPQKHPVQFVESTPKDQLQPKVHTFDYLKPGDRIAHPRPRLFDVAKKQHVPISDELFPQPWSIGELRWDRDSQRFSFLYNQRGHQVLRVVAVDKQGSATAIIDEKSPTFIDYNAKRFYHRLEETSEILWMSERDGWNHLWLYDAATGEVKNQVTHGPWVVRQVEHVDEEQRQVWFMAGGVRPEQDPYYQHLCRVNFDGSDFTILIVGDGTHEITFSPDRQWFLDKWSRVDQPPITELRRAADGHLMCVLERADHKALLDTGWTTPERFVAPGRDGETSIYGIIVRPSNFDPKKRYPVVEQIYAGPHSAHVPKAFSTLVRQHAMAELGFILVQIDGMGTNWRSKQFHDMCWQNLADAGYPDRIAWIKAVAKTRPWMNLDRVGIYGGSAGGQNAMRALIDHHDFYQVAVADCGCHDNRMDKIWWNELWMGYPIGPHYEASSNSVHAHRMQGKLMLIVGELDRNVDPASTMQVVAALQKADKDFDLVVVAGAGHGAAETTYGSRRRSDFLVRHLHGHEPRGDTDE